MTMSSVASALCAVGLAVGLHAQASSTERDYTLEAVSTENPNGTLSITSNSARPLWQALSVLYSKYGIEVDYEDPHYSDDQLYGPPGVGRRLKGGRFTATVPLKKPTATAQNYDTVMVESLVKQYDRIGPVKFEVYSHKTGNRIDVTPAKSSQRPLLDTPVVIDGENLSVEDVINATLRQVAKVSGNCLERGGLVDNSLAAKMTLLKTTRATPAREILAQALDEMDTKRIWLVTYEPQNSCFYLGVFIVQELIDNHIRPVRQTRN